MSNLYDDVKRALPVSNMGYLAALNTSGYGFYDSGGFLVRKVRRSENIPSFYKSKN
ncbi:uncharacterized protein RSE6_02473 [Rhynchosporium secalis]|uniref:Uncharacterized protein n=1 Tax=Rhynchosporium secalis TaxID=38038 RepID=A0A1E1M0C7_RHYSE|nr:uncharacterized protein RSE6_02473 [Rhynchosporium secalis]